MFWDTLLDNLVALERIYKYRRWDDEHHRNLLIRNEIYFPSACSLDDDSETKIPLCFEKGTDDQLLQLSKRIINEDNPQINEDNVSKQAKEWLRQLRSDSRQFDNFHVWEQNKKYTEFGIFSASEIKDSISMWNNPDYANNHKGFCVGFRTDILADFIQRNVKRYRIMPHPVEYYNDFPILNPFESDTKNALIKSLITKSNDWAYQRELRLVLIGHVGKALNKEDRTIILDEDIIAEVILGAKISKEDKRQIIANLKQRRNKVQLQRAKLINEGNRLIFEEIAY